MTALTDTTLAFRCVACAKPLTLPEGEGTLSCACGQPYTYRPGHLSYPFDALLYRRFRKQFLLNKVLSNNGYISYQTLKEGSLSLPDRPDVAQFREFIRAHAAEGRLLDVGCGMLELPGYLDFGADGPRFELVGLDPIADGDFRGLRIVGCSEFMPFADASFETLVYGTSLDHVCSLEQTLRESHRVLKPSGRLLIWMGDRHETPYLRVRLMLSRLKGWLHHRFRTEGVDYPYRDGRFVIYPNYQVFYVPHGAPDPYHAYRESPKKLVRMMRRAGFDLVEMKAHNKDLVLLCLERREVKR